MNFIHVFENLKQFKDERKKYIWYKFFMNFYNRYHLMKP